MNETPKSLRLQVGIFGRTNVGKSSFLNMVAGQDVAITSAQAGTTTDVVEKTMELAPFGPVVLLDTAGLDDESALSLKRLEKTRGIFDRADIAVLIVEPGVWTGFEEEVLKESRLRNIPVVAVVNKADRGVQQEYLSFVMARTGSGVAVSSVDAARRDDYVRVFKSAMTAACPDARLQSGLLLGDLVPSGGLVVMVVPIDLQAPQGRLILPQVQALRDALDADAAALVVKEREYGALLRRLKSPPDLVLCDSQAVLKMVADTPDTVACTTFSILFSRWKGELLEAVRGARLIEKLKPSDKVLIAEACSHHAIEDDIGRVKIPRWLRQFTGADIVTQSCAGRDYPDNLGDFKLIIHCGACMLTRREMLNRIARARSAGTAITNYGIAIACLQGVLPRVLSPFPAALEMWRSDQPRA